MFRSQLWTAAVAAACVGLCLPTSHATTSPPGAQPAPLVERAGASLAGLPFIANRGQTDARVAYYTDTFAGRVFVTHAGDVVYRLHAGAATDWVLTERFVGGRSRPRPRADELAPSRVAFLRADRSLEDVPTVQRLSFNDVWPGVDVALAARPRNFEKIFTIAPGASPDAIRLAIEGALSLRVDAGDGSLVIETGHGPVRFAAPIAFQPVAGADPARALHDPAARVAVAARYRVEDGAYGFEVGAHDPDRPLLIDPYIQSTYLGGGGTSFGIEAVRAIAIHPTNGEVYVAGFTDSTDFPAVAGGAVATSSVGNGFIARLSADLTTLLQATYIGAASGDGDANALLVTATDVFVAGRTVSGFPTTVGSAQPSDPNPGTAQNGFIARLPLSLASITSATYLGGTQNLDTQVNALLLHPTNGALYACGETRSATLPNTAGGFDASNVSGERAAFVVRMPVTLASFTQISYFGDRNRCTGMTADPGSNEVYLVGGGFTGLGAIPNTVGGALDGLSSGAWIARLNETLTANPQSTWITGLGASNIAEGAAIQRHPSNGDIYVLSTSKTGAQLPANATTSGGQSTCSGTFNCLVVLRLNPSLTAVVNGTFYGNANNSFGGPTLRGFNGHMTIDPVSGDVFAVADGNPNLPNTGGGLQPTQPTGSSTPGLAVRLRADLGAIIQATYLGGNGLTQPQAVAVHPTNTSLYIAGGSTSNNFPNTAGGARPTLQGGSDAFIARVTPDLLGAASAGALQFAAATFSSPEGDTTVQIGVTRSGGSAGAVSVQYATSNGSATAGADYTAASGTLNWADGDTATKFFGVALLDDAAVEGGETINLALSNAGGGATLGTQTSAVLTITDNDVAAPVVSLSASALNFGTVNVGATSAAQTSTLTNTGNAALVVGTVTRTGANAADFTVGTDTCSGQTIAPNASCSLGVTFAPTAAGARAAQLSVPSNASGSPTVVGLTGTGVQPASQPGTIQFGAASYSVNENGGSVTLTLTRTAGTDGAVGVSVASGGGSATAGTDYTALSTTVSWAAGDGAAKTVVLNVLDDAANEGNETVTVTLSAPSGGAALGTPPSAVVTIVDNDAPEQQTVTVEAKYGKGGGGSLGLLTLLALLLGAGLRMRAPEHRCATAPRAARGVTWAAMLLSASAAPAVAADEAGWFVGASAGVARSSLSGQDVASRLAAAGFRADVDAERSRFAATLSAGYRFAAGPTLSAAFVQLGRYDVDVTATTASSAALASAVADGLGHAGRGARLSVGWAFALGRGFELEPRIGLLAWRSRIDVTAGSTFVTRSENESDPAFGLQLAWIPRERWAFTFEADRYRIGSRNDVDTLQLGLRRRLR